MVGQINHHLYRKRGFYYFCRRVPKALLEHYPKPRIVVALKTRQFRDALRQSQIISKRLDDQWFHMQLDAMGLDNVQSMALKDATPLPASICLMKQQQTDNQYLSMISGVSSMSVSKLMMRTDGCLLLSVTLA